FDVDRADARGLQATLQLAPQLDVFVQQVGVLTIGVPARLPRLVVAEAKSVWMNFLSHSSPNPTSCPSSELAACQSKLCERGAWCHARPSAIPLRPHWPHDALQRQHDAQPRQPTDAPCASGSGTRGPSEQDANASTAAPR